MEELFYIQDKARGYVGNCMVWWKHNNQGYVCDIREAKVWTKEEAETRLQDQDDLRMWPKKYIDERVKHHIDMQDCDHKHSMKNDEYHKYTVGQLINSLTKE